MKYFIRKVGSIIHHWHERAYTLWKVREIDVRLSKLLDYNERVFFLHFIPALTGKKLIVYDIGAASGIASRCFAKLSNVQAVHSFEPIPSAFAELIEHTRQYPQVKQYKIALGDENCVMNMNVIEDMRDSSSLLTMKQLHKTEFPKYSYREHTEKVRVVRLDDFVAENNLPFPNVIKMDVQGYEDRVFRGGSKIICQSDYCILEISLESLYENSPLFDDIYQQMRKMGFRLIGIGSSIRGVSGRHLQLDGIFQNEFTQQK
jgi:FkbM family methyltransferase